MRKPRKQRGHIFRVNGSWYGRWYEERQQPDASLKRVQVCGKLCDYSDTYHNKSDVQPILDEKLRHLNAENYDARSSTPVHQFVTERFLSFVESTFKPSTAYGYKRLWLTYLRDRLDPKIPLRDFRCVDATKLLARIHQETGVGYVQLQHIKAFLSGAFTQAIKDGILPGKAAWLGGKKLIEGNPIQLAEIPHSAKKPEKTRAASAEEVEAILKLKGLSDQCKIAIRLVYYLGLRPGEARGLLWNDYTGDVITVRQSVWRKNVTSPKTENSLRTLPIVGTLKKELDAFHKAQGNLINGYILKGERGGPLNLDQLAWKQIRPVVEAAGFSWKGGWYSLRRGFGTKVENQTESIAAAAAALGNTPKVAARHYVKPDPMKVADIFKVVQQPSSQTTSWHRNSLRSGCIVRPGGSTK